MMIRPRETESLRFADQLSLILQTNNSRAALEKKLRETHTEEPVLMYGDAHQFTREKNPKKRGVLGHKIMETYIIGSAPKQINFKSSTLQDTTMMYNLSCVVSKNPSSTKTDLIQASYISCMDTSRKVSCVVLIDYTFNTPYELVSSTVNDPSIYPQAKPLCSPVSSLLEGFHYVLQIFSNSSVVCYVVVALQSLNL